MKPINEKAQKIFDAIMAILGDNDHVKIDNSPGMFMALSVDRLGFNRVALAHNFVQNGDLMADPDMEFVIQDGRAYPVNFTNHPTGQYQEADPLRPAIQAGLKQFANLWLVNINEQQGILAMAAKPAPAAETVAPAAETATPADQTVAPAAPDNQPAPTKAAPLFKVRRAKKHSRPAADWARARAKNKPGQRKGA